MSIAHVPASLLGVLVLAVSVIPCAARAGANPVLSHAPPYAKEPVASVSLSPGDGGSVALRAAGSATVLIPGGTFTMGSDDEEIAYAVLLCQRAPTNDTCDEKYFAREAEAHEVILSAFRIDRTEVTVAAYRRCVEAGRCLSPNYAAGGERFDRADLPVSLVSWNDADTYCQFAGGRLPTEAEWERAARGTSGRRFPWGNLFNGHFSNHGAESEARDIFAFDQSRARARVDDGDGFAELAPVSSFPLGRTPDGIDDMAGNVAEWVADAVDDEDTSYPPASEVNPTGAGGGPFHVVRGGGYQESAAWLRTTARRFVSTSYRAPFLGFRCAYPEGLP